MNYTGKIIILAFPDTFVTMSSEWICKILPFFGLGTKHFIKAGHAALVLIENKTGKAHYFDFGRYVTPKGYGRVRGATTDAELHLPITATFTSEGALENLDQFLLWLSANPQKTHGEGRLLSSVCDAIHFEKAAHYIKTLQQRGSIPYGAFVKEGSNCARFVTDTLIAATNNRKILNSLKFNKLFTPSTVGNVEKGANQQGVFETFNERTRSFSGSALKENLTNYFDKKKPTADTHRASDSATSKTTSLHQLRGTGSSAWFELTSLSLPKDHYNIRRYNSLGAIDYDGVYHSEIFDASLPFTFTYDSHCAFCHVFQNNKKIKLEGLGSVKDFNS